MAAAAWDEVLGADADADTFGVGKTIGCDLRPVLAFSMDLVSILLFIDYLLD